MFFLNEILTSRILRHLPGWYEDNLKENKKQQFWGEKQVKLIQ